MTADKIENSFSNINIPWAIQPDYLAEFAQVRQSPLGASLLTQPLSAKTGIHDNRQILIQNDVAIIYIQGPIVKNMDPITFYFGGVSSRQILRQINFALRSSAIKTIILSIDSPGGTVDGTFELADYVFRYRKRKNIIAFADGLMASAAYAIGSAASKLYVSGQTAQLGAIGVVSVHVDISGYENKKGIKTTEIYAGKYKCISSPYGPLSDEGRENIQSQVDYLYSVFVDRVAKQRGVSSKVVLRDMADGRLFFGEESIRYGLADEFSSIPQLIAKYMTVKEEETV